MRHVCSHLYAEYGRYIDNYRAIPKDSDCLKLVERRLLLTLHQSARTKFEKSAKVVGLCLAYHPHGDKSTYDALVKLVQRGFVEGRGNWGRIGWNDSAPASMRYTECKANENLDSGFAEYLDYIDWDVLEIEKEPLFLPYPIPIGLIGSGLTIGIGFHRTLIPRYKLKDLAIRLLDLLENKEEKTIIKPYIENCQVISNDFEQILTQGTGKITIIPDYQVNTYDIIITGVVPTIKFNKLKEFNFSFEQENGVPYFEHLDLWTIKSKTPIQIQITPYGAKRRKVTEEFVEKIISKITSTENISIYVSDSNNIVRLKSIDELLLLSFNNWKQAKLKYFRDKLSKILIKIEELKIIKIIQEYYNKNNQVKKISDLIKIIIQDYPDLQSDYLKKLCDKYSITKLIEWNTDLVPLQNEANFIQSIIDDIDNYAIQELRKRFSLKN